MNCKKHGRKRFRAMRAIFLNGFVSNDKNHENGGQDIRGQF